MSSLFGTMSVAVNALLAQQTALQTTAENISNVNTPGYSRKRAVMVEDAPVSDGLVAVGNGVRVDTIEGLRDRVLELRMHEETQQRAESDGYLSVMQQAEINFSDVNNGIGSKMDDLFGALADASVNPASIPARQNVLTAADNLVRQFRTTSQNLSDLGKSLNTSLEQDATEINSLVGEIARLNVEVTRVEKLGGDPGTFEDQRTQRIRDLSALMDVSVVNSDDGLTITAGNGATLVVGAQAQSLEIRANADGSDDIYSAGENITRAIEGGSAGGILRARTEIASIQDSLNQLASGFAKAMNDAQQQGFDLNGDAGQALFTVPASDAAANLALAISDPSALALGKDGTAGDNRNVATFQAVQNSAVVGQSSPGDFYSNMVAGIGNDVLASKAERDAADSVLQQLSSQRDAISGVSLDEEAANLIRYQRAFEAAARVVSVIDQMMDLAVNLGKG